MIWGAATSAYQIEGAAEEDGKGLNIWDIYCRQPGKIFGGHTGDMACDHYHRYREDIGIMKQIGISAYRFSISWARILPQGQGTVNEEGIAFYNRLIDELITNGIEPYITLFHWDYPYALYQRGGWMNPDSVNWFAEYARLVTERFSDRVRYFITFNEPQCFIGMGHVTGEHAPGLKNPLHDGFLMAHHVMMAHGKAVQAMRAAAKRPIMIGYAPTSTVSAPASRSQEDIEAARARYFACPEDAGGWSWNVSWWSDPVMLGRYPEDGVKRYEEYLPDIRPGDLELMHQPLDFYGQNIYNAYQVKAGADGRPMVLERPAGYETTAMGWPVTPESLYWGPKFLYERYGKPIYITENGMACHDMVSRDGRVHDASRIDFMDRYIESLLKAREDGTDIRGYFYWSLLDNFEWAEGYKDRFGLVYVDYATQRRVLKDSAEWYRKWIAGENG